MEISFSELILKSEISGMSLFKAIDFSLKAFQEDRPNSKFSLVQANAADFLLSCLRDVFEDYSALKLVVDTGPSSYSPLENFILYVHCEMRILKTVITPARIEAMVGHKNQHNVAFSQNYDASYRDNKWKSLLKNLAYELKDKDCQEKKS